MVQTKKGAQKARKTMIKKLGKKGYLEHFKAIGAIGGRNGHTGGFAYDVNVAREAGAKGGKRSKAGLKFLRVERGKNVYLNKEGKEVKFAIGESMHAVKGKNGRR